MKVFILCGGYGTRLDYEGKIKAKPMVEIAKKPILMHIIENFYNQSFNEFVLCLGHKAETIINYFIKEKKKYVKIIERRKDNIYLRFSIKKKFFFINLVNTGVKTGTGGRILVANKILNLNEDIIMTYGDGLSNVDIKKLKKFHYKNKAEITLTAVRPKQRYGIIGIKNKVINFFDNSNKKINTYINGGFFVISKHAIKKIKNKSIYWEKEPMTYFIKKKKLLAFKHSGFWKSLDTLKDKNDFNLMIKNKKQPWVI
jgi:glucose-1-phosphate cytidylyltransferase